MLVRHHLNLTGTKRPMCGCGWFHQQKTICRRMYTDFGLMVWERRGWYGQTFTAESLKKGGWQWTLAFSAVYRIYSTININRLREDWRRIFMDTKQFTFELNIQCSTRKGNGKQKPLQVDSIFGKWANKTWTHTCKRQAVLRSVLTLNFHSTLKLAL